MTNLEDSKKMLRGMRNTVDRVNTLVARSQGNLKKNIYEPKMKILASVSDGETKR